MLLTRLARSFQWLAIVGALAYALALYLRNLLAWPANVSVHEWWGSELAIRYCAGFVRRGLLGQSAWQATGWMGQQQHYVSWLALGMAAAALVLGGGLGWLLVRFCGWRLGLLILAAPAGWPVLMVHGGGTFRKDALQILLGALLLWWWRDRVAGRSVARAPAAWLGLGVVQVVAVCNHEPFALLTLPLLALAAWWERRRLVTALLAVAPGVLAFLFTVWRRGNAEQVSCLQADLQRLGLLASGEQPGSSITELALSRPSFFTWDLTPPQLGWSLVHGITMTAAVVLAYAVVMQVRRPHEGGRTLLVAAASLWGLQLLAAAPLFLATIDYGRWITMMFCSGLVLLLLQPSIQPATALPAQPDRAHRLPLATALAVLLILVLPSHCCTYGPQQIFAWIPYAAASQWKQLLLGWLAGVA